MNTNTIMVIQIMVVHLTNLCVDGVTSSLHIMEHLALQVHLSL